MHSSVTGLKLAIFGFAFKANTGDTRESPAIDICKFLLEEKANLCIYDPKVPHDQIRLDLLSGKMSDEVSDLNALIDIQDCPYKTASGARAIIVCTDWEEFKV